MILFCCSKETSTWRK